ncbi:hypothetical protein J3E69DRAFT_337196 [Trichoderma sp. SZMC 28015]
MEPTACALILALVALGCLPALDGGATLARLPSLEALLEMLLYLGTCRYPVCLTPLGCQHNKCRLSTKLFFYI